MSEATAPNHETRLQKGMILWTSVLVVLLGGASVKILVAPPTGFESSLPGQERSSREPASVGNLAVEYKLPCGPATEVEMPEAVAQVRLVGQSCRRKKEIESSEIRNESNGFSASVFYTPTGAFTTDYMTLGPDENKIRITHVFKSGGGETRELTIRRQKSKPTDQNI